MPAGFTKLGADVFLRFPGEKAALAAVFHPAVEFFPQGLRQMRFGKGAVVHHRLGGGEAAQFIDNVLRPVFS
ncbi:hypothetical protein SDC9_200184 [bioreactor metagenome]|uniref:Uncharacterized protein n=1 Tax=bioreactor metagenome TaxID=1076179 RepID=A0A645INT7_9ZZZZ